VALLEWSPAFGVGIGAIDKDHRAVMAAVNALQVAVEGGGDLSVTGPLLNKLNSDTRAHFSAEESLMTITRYPGTALHAMKHQHLLDQLDAFVARNKRDHASLNVHSLNFLRDWVTTHIQSEDRNFGLWLNEHGKR
jgi:hemerythrin-like metal-binding protein